MSRFRERTVHAVSGMISPERKAKLLVRLDDFRIRTGLYTRHEKELLRFRDTCGGACFIIGNGPSLRKEDLEGIARKGYATFASNKIYKIFPETEWRPDWYACVDRMVFSQNTDEILTQITCPMMLYHKTEPEVRDWEKKHGTEKDSVYFCTYHYCEGIEKFRPDAAVIESGGTVTYVLIELAWMLGYREIYLIGCDHHYASFAGQASGELIGTDAQTNRDYFMEGYLHPGEKMNVGNLEKSTAGYETARRYIESHGGKIFNATRGGKLEVFERADIDQLV